MADGSRGRRFRRRPRTSLEGRGAVRRRGREPCPGGHEGTSRNRLVGAGPVHAGGLPVVAVAARSSARQGAGSSPRRRSRWRGYRGSNTWFGKRTDVTYYATCPCDRTPATDRRHCCGTSSSRCGPILPSSRLLHWRFVVADRDTTYTAGASAFTPRHTRTQQRAGGRCRGWVEHRGVAFMSDRLSWDLVPPNTRVRLGARRNEQRTHRARDSTVATSEPRQLAQHREHEIGRPQHTAVPPSVEAHPIHDLHRVRPGSGRSPPTCSTIAAA